MGGRIGEDGQRRYRVRSVLGRGGAGTVYRADQLGPRGFVRKVALKVLNRDMATHAELATRLRDEARLLALVRHRAIVQVDGLVMLDGRWTIVMELVEGADLDRLVLALGPIPAGPALEIVAEVAGALHVAHTCTGPDGAPLELLHRDLKPTNLLLTPHGEVKVVDFGVARARFAGRESTTHEVTFGTPGYVAPERMDLEERPAGDIYGLGAVLYELLAGKALGQSDIRPSEHARWLDTSLQALADLPDALHTFLRQLLAHDPDTRPTARQVESRARDLRTEVGGPWLRDWAETTLARLPPPTIDDTHDFSDSVIVERPLGSQRSGNATLDLGDSIEEWSSSAHSEPGATPLGTWAPEGPGPVPLEGHLRPGAPLTPPAPVPAPPQGLQTTRPTTEETSLPETAPLPQPSSPAPARPVQPPPKSPGAEEPQGGLAGLMVLGGAVLVVVPTGFVLGVAAVLLVWALAS